MSTRPAEQSTEQPDSKKQKVEETATTTETKYALYSYWRSGASWRVRTALALKGLAYEYRAINLLKGEQASGDYAKKNPQLKVPLLLIGDDKSVSQSMAIIDYLEQAHPDKPSLMPKDPYLRAKAISLAEGFNADTQPLQNLHVLTRLEQVSSAEAKAEWARWAVSKGLKAFEEDVATTMGEYCVGDSVTLADVFLVPQLYSARRFNVDLAPYPNLLRIEAKLEQLPAFKAAHPDQQPDKPAQ